jgi:heat shock protein HtpX
MRFLTRSLLLLFVLYALVFAVGDAYLVHGQAPLWLGVIFVLVLIGAQYLISPWLIEAFFTIHWDHDAVPAAQRAFIERLCHERGIPMPRMGLIDSGTPNAFAFGRIRNDARIVITSGLLEMLTEEEANAVLAHELGHIANYDFAVMAVASMAPLLLYQIYVWTDRISNLRIVSYAAYLAYWIGQFMVLLLNRTREYGADHFSAKVTGSPNLLSAALVKICYGMVREQGEIRRLAKEGDSSEKKAARRRQQFGQALGMMGIASAKPSNALALGILNAEQAARVMRWDLVNPWAKFYELGSTHPLTAMRLRELNRAATDSGHQVAYPLPEDTPTRWTGFPVEFLFWVAPLACGFAIITWLWTGSSLHEMGLHMPQHFVPWMLVALGATWAARIAFRYHGVFERRRVNELLEDLSVSQMRPRPVEVEGEIVGHGLPGAFWSPDLVLRDETGMMFLHYRSSLPFGRLLFALRSADRLVGERVDVQGWYRRGAIPYIEISRVQARVPKAREASEPATIFSNQKALAALEYEQIDERSYSRWIQLGVAAVCSAAGVILLMR